MSQALRFIIANTVTEDDRNGNPRRLFILCQHATKYDLEHPYSLLLPGLKKHVKVDEHFKIISFETRIRFKHAIESCKDNVPRVFILLNQLFTEDAIKRYFNDIWLVHNNIRARKQNTREFQMHRKAVNEGSIKTDRTHNEVTQVFSNTSIRKVAKLSIT